eukprot:TRINITY_DN35910_c1_g2_i1.p1 TRINITY_DN35910_c1_g2~~TRINITY_DN35910_c1_g2_i1.p1  ORF type:complete len:1030 (-),score=152.33 TRINITY_DN35910_c1_g2_i1:159-3248(-)
MRDFEWPSFQSQVNEALETVRRVLDVNKRAELADNVSHRYEDKYILAEFLVNTAIASQLHALSRLGLSRETLTRLVEWAKDRSVSLEFSVAESCSLSRSETSEVESGSKMVSNIRWAEMQDGGPISEEATITRKTVTTITKYFWSWNAQFDIVAYSGVGDTSERTLIRHGVVTEQIETTSECQPFQTNPAKKRYLVEVSWLLRHLHSDDLTPQYSICRTAAGCATPFRNTDTAQSLRYFDEFDEWARCVRGYFFSCNAAACRHACINSARQRTFAPVIPLLRDREREKADKEMAKVTERDTNASECLNDSDCLLPQVSDGLAVAIGDEVAHVVRRDFLHTFGDRGTFGPEELRGTLRVAVGMGEQDIDFVMSEIFRGRLPGERLEVHEVVDFFFPISSYSPGGSRTLLSVADANKLLEEERRALGQHCKESVKEFPAHESAVILAVVLHHTELVACQLRRSLNHIESMLHRQLEAAIGKQVSPANFDAYMRFHYRKLFLEDFQPLPFSYAVRRSARHAPEGWLSLESAAAVGTWQDALTRDLPEPLLTMTSSHPAAHEMHFTVGAATRVRFRGHRYLHAACLQSFADEDKANLSIVARACQFSCIMVLVGRIVSAREFDPMYAAVLKNKDELMAPLSISTIPTPKEFRDAIGSLSPEQQRFAKAFRAMQLESTLLGILVIQIKPQIEGLLGLPEGALARELQLTEDLIELFQKYQVSSDLLCPDADYASSSKAKVDAVKENVQAARDAVRQGMQSTFHESRAQLAMIKSKCAAAVAEEKERCRAEIERIKAEAKEAEAEERCYRRRGGSPEMECYAMAKTYEACAETRQRVMMPEPVLVEQSQAVNERPDVRSSNDGMALDEEEGVMDYTNIPKELDRRFLELDEDGCLRPTIITPSDSWTKRSQRDLLSDTETSVLCSDELKTEKDAAFDLLDALTRSGSMALVHASLHIVIAATHCFCKTVIDTVVEDNINPIDKVEKSTLIMASTIHRTPVARLIQGGEILCRVRHSSPALFEDVVVGDEGGAHAV